MKIDVTNGSISFDAGRIERGCHLRSFLTSAIGATSREAHVNAGWVNRDFSPEPGFLGTALFKNNFIHQLFFLIPMPTDQLDDWSETQELKRKALHDAWLLTELGDPPYEYAWGSVTSDYDPKGRVSEIIVTYAD